MRLHRTVKIAFLRKCKVSHGSEICVTEYNLRRPQGGQHFSAPMTAVKQEAHPYAIEAILESRQRKKRYGTTEIQHLLKWQPPELGKSGKIADIATPEDLKLLQARAQHLGRRGSRTPVTPFAGRVVPCYEAAVACR
ncbi:hypothetical protein CSUI_002617 [Cystoisospora suis]|uniref:Uncharacterized protein n=1 Tax=Cystoisospora suis TaxID=483139 RepID=A0A2C6L8Q6_9APIC|nr:hypothetical protein CSUI_002617 [Cystoisospora suis]